MRAALLLPLFWTAGECFAPARRPVRGTVQGRARAGELRVIDHQLALEMGAARGAFALCFYGALGVGSIGRELIPIVFGRYEANGRDAAAEAAAAAAVARGARGGREGGPRTDLGVRGYPAPVYLEDVAPILANRLDAAAIARKYRPEDVSGPRFQYTHVGERDPFLTYEAYRLANPGADRTALRAVFDSFSDSIGGGNAVSPITAQQRIDQYAGDVTVMARRLNGSKALGVTAFVFVLALLGFADYVTIYHLWRGFFPEWQGFGNMPSSLWDGDVGIASLSKYFVWEIPDV